MHKQRILLVEDDMALAKALKQTLTGAGYDVVHEVDGSRALSALSASDFDLLLSDVQMSPMDGVALLQAVANRFIGLPVVMMTAFATVNKAVAAMRAGASGYLVKPFAADALLGAIADAMNNPLATGNQRSHSMVCGDESTLTLLGIASRVARSSATVLLAGESGTGKEVFARYLHDNSERSDQPFVAINCAAIPESMLEATLFGHEKGAFTGADRSMPGKFELADGGTLLLDEISEMDLGLQAKLLRALQEREVERLGGKKTIALDVRVLATSNRNLAKEVEAGRFREDLYYRLNVFPLYIPPLRERRGDVLPLVQHFLSLFCHGVRAVPKLSPMAEKRLLQYGWPGNVRELENVVQRSLILLSGGEICESDLAFEIDSETLASTNGTSAPEVGKASRPTGDLSHDLRLEERRLIIGALQEGAGNREAAARILGISPRTLRYKMARLREANLPVPADLAGTGAHSSVA